MIFFIWTSLSAQEEKKIFSHPEYVEGFTIKQKKGFQILEISKMNQGDMNTLPESYVLVHKDSSQLIETLKKTYKHLIKIPVNRMVVTSTTHLPGIEMLGAAKTVVGFPGTQYVSSASFRSLIASGHITELGQQEQLNIEMVLSVAPEIVIGFAIGEKPKAYLPIEKSGIPVLLNHDWLAHHPLGKAAWIYLYGALLNKLERSDEIFKSIHDRYMEARALAQKANTAPTVLSGAMYKDVWYAPGGNSWAAQFIQDANGTYIFKNDHTGSDAYSIEYVLNQGKEAQFWVGPAQFTSYEALRKSSPHYQQFRAFQKQNIFSFSAKKGTTGGVLYYELAPQRPDLVLRDLIAILHPNVLAAHTFTFFTSLDD